jgi:molybdopterin-containing oxidoreductase family iron-sulfur binding subunit
MSETVFNRRDFLKLLGIGVAGAAGGCSQPSEKLIPYLVAPQDILPGVAYWYASTCNECSSGCGILVKAREGRAIKIEGNPAHPVNAGGLCARGHAALQGLYDPDRLKTPMMREGETWKPASWDEALARVASEMARSRSGGKQMALVTGHETGSFAALARDVAAAAGGTHLAFEPFGMDAVREASRRTFGVAEIPHHDFESAEFVLSFGADFLETWGNPVYQARQFAAMRARPSTRFVAVEPRLSNTGANADEWIAVPAGTEMVLALGLAHVILADNLAAVSDRGALMDAVREHTPEAVEAATGVPAAKVRELAGAFVKARPSLAVAGGVAAQSEQAVALVAAVNLLNYVAGNLGRTVRFDRLVNHDGTASLDDLQKLVEQISDGKVGMLVVHGANPVYATPAWVGFGAALEKVPFKVALATSMDETAAKCDLVLPVLHSLETVGDAESLKGLHSIVQPSMQKLPMFDARPAGDVLIAVAKGAGAGSLPATWSAYVENRWKGMQSRYGAAGQPFDVFWNETLKKGFVGSPSAASGARWTGAPTFAAPSLKGAGDMALVVFPTMNFHDGRSANRPWMQELPEATTKAVWGSWAELHPATAQKLGVKMGDAVTIETENGKVSAPAFVWGGVREDVVAIPLGQGHTNYGRYATNRGVNPVALLAPAQDAASGTLAYLSTKARVTKGGDAMELVRTQRYRDDDEREIGQVIPVSALLGTAAANGHGEAGGHGEAAAHGDAGGHAAHPSQTRPGKYTEPRQMKPGEKIPAHAVTAFEQEHKVRSPRQIPVSQGNYGTAKHRWAMAIDTNACNGCGACVTACHAENNIPFVGPEPIKRGREMSWIRIERFEKHVAPGNGRNDVRFVPMMCQHCGDAPCETVCPVYATYHNPEGLNAQVYNRCVGTRYCSNNCPYKVRSFNFWDYSAPEKPSFAFHEPLNWQLNPDVTVRSKGVMEKCTMCVQRILEGKGHARDENRELRDGDFTTACAQSCPAQAIVFGDLMDPESKVSKLSHGERRYWALAELNTKPGVTYLKKIQRETVS